MTRQYRTQWLEHWHPLNPPPAEDEEIFFAPGPIVLSPEQIEAWSHLLPKPGDNTENLYVMGDNTTATAFGAAQGFKLDPDDKLELRYTRGPKSIDWGPEEVVNEGLQILALIGICVVSFGLLLGWAL